MRLKNIQISGAIALAVICVSAFLFFFPVFFSGKTFYPFDNLLYSLPWKNLVPGYTPLNMLINDAINDFYISHKFMKYCYEHNILPFWNNFLFCGNLAGTHTYTSPVFFVLFYIFPVTYAHDILLFIHLIATGAFTYFYLRQIGLKGPASLLGAVAWMFNGYAMTWFEVEYLPVMSGLLAASLLFIERWLVRKTLLSWLGIVISIALTVGASYANSLYFQLIFTGVYFLYRAFVGEMPGITLQKVKSFFRTALLFGLALLTAFLLSLNFFVLHLEHYRENQRGEIRYEELSDRYAKVYPEYLITMLYPDFFGNPAFKFILTPAEKDKNPYNNYSELCIYSGVLSVFLAAAAIIYARRRRHVTFYGICALVILLMAMGSPLYYPLWRFLPGLDFANPTRCLYIFGFCVSMLAALGMDVLDRRENISRKMLAGVWFFILAVAVALAVSAQFRCVVNFVLSCRYNAEPFEKAKAYLSLSSYSIFHPLVLVIISFFLLLIVLFMKNSKTRQFFLFLISIPLIYDLMSFSMNFNSLIPREMEYPSTPAIEFLKRDKALFRCMTFNGIVMDNALLPFNIEDIGGYSSVFSRRYADYIFISQMTPGTTLPGKYNYYIIFKNWKSPLLDIINMKYVLLPKAADIGDDKFKLVYDGEMRIFENKGAFDRIFFVPEYLFCASKNDTLKHLRNFSAEDFRRRVILEDMPLPPGKTSYPDLGCDIVVQSYMPGHIVFSANAGADGFLVISDGYDSAWKAEIDGKEEKILRANYIMKALRISPGAHRIELHYRPWPLIIGIYISVAGWILILALVFISAFRNFRAGRRN
ncbi:MAG: hypothetical protein A2017_03230 [Lentisphaerae bacterium GWF2_44_16]|nr:MAG: hypothetical protein A2017_03230 [Lentisphaerae bacterium GWF2_44_16]